MYKEVNPELQHLVAVSWLSKDQTWGGIKELVDFVLEDTSIASKKNLKALRDGKVVYGRQFSFTPIFQDHIME